MLNPVFVSANYFLKEQFSGGQRPNLSEFINGRSFLKWEVKKMDHSHLDWMSQDVEFWDRDENFLKLSEGVKKSRLWMIPVKKSVLVPGFAAAVRRGRDRHQCDLACDCNRKASHVMTPYPCSRAKPLGHVPRPRPTCWPPTSSSLQSRRAWRTGRTLGAPSRRVRGRTASHSYSRCEVWN